jgi:hypothetical protein
VPAADLVLVEAGVALGGLEVLRLDDGIGARIAATVTDGATIWWDERTKCRDRLEDSVSLREYSK